MIFSAIGPILQVDRTDPSNPILAELNIDTTLSDLLDPVDVSVVLTHPDDTLEVGDQVTLSFAADAIVDGGALGDVTVALTGGGQATYLGQTASGDFLVDGTFNVDVAASNIFGSLNDTITISGEAFVGRARFDDNDLMGGDPLPDILTQTYDLPVDLDTAVDFSIFYLSGVPAGGSGFMPGDNFIVLEVPGGDDLSGFTYDYSELSLDTGYSVGTLNIGDHALLNIAATLTSPDGLTVISLPPTSIRVTYEGTTPGGGLILTSDNQANIPATATVTDPITGATTVDVLGTIDTEGFFAISSTDLVTPEDDAALVFYTPFDIVCFAEGTRIATPAGETAVESLAIGDLVMTAEGASVPVKWVGRQTILHRFRPAERLALVRIIAGALGENMPARDLTVTVDHAILLDGVMIHAGALVNGSTIRRLGPSELPVRSVVYHIETEDHSVILAEGVATETFVDNVARSAFDNHAEYLALYGAATEIDEAAFPRAKGVRQVPVHTRKRLAARATALSVAVA